MAKDPSDVADKTALGRKAGDREEIVLRDESDEIIDNLKNQLQSLQSQLDEYKAAEPEPGQGPPPGGGGDDEMVRAWNAGLAPHLASRLQVPAEELTQRLGRLIDQVDEPELRAELERCRDLAFFLFDTYRKISSSHQLLTESLTAPRGTVEMTDFCRLLEHVYPASGTPMAVRKAAGLPARIKFASRSAVTVMTALAELAQALFGGAMHIEVGHVAPENPAPEDSAPGEPGRLRLRILGEAPREGAQKGEAVSEFAMRQGVTANRIVDLLYVEKIIELQGGTFAFHRSQGRVHGFEVLLPHDPPEN